MTSRLPRSSSLLPAGAIPSGAGDAGDYWRPIDTAPQGAVVIVRVVRRGQGFPAILERHVNSLREYFVWRATGARYPKSWTHGTCWDINDYLRASAEPVEWRPLPESASTQEEDE